MENETRTLAEGFPSHRTRHPEAGAEVYALPGDAAGHLVAAPKEAEPVGGPPPAPPAE
ncbi:hypothetical protein [Streptomyces sp. NPDC051636]|uniref:hypothetical protein n=1 Tax=Streptomyces sp. NPDC051636 TaxID=3365663 RepID=UPI0037A87CA1